MSNPESPPELSIGAVFRAMKRDPTLQGCHMLGEDGVLRSFGGPPERVVFDAVGLSSVQIKQLLDKQPWEQETEDKFRGVDGRKVIDHEALFNPPDNFRPPRYTPEEVEANRIKIKELNRRMMEKIEKERQDGVDVEAKYACDRVQADYDLSPKKDGRANPI